MSKLPADPDFEGFFPGVLEEKPENLVSKPPTQLPLKEVNNHRAPDNKHQVWHNRKCDYHGSPAYYLVLAKHGYKFQLMVKEVCGKCHQYIRFAPQTPELMEKINKKLEKFLITL